MPYQSSTSFSINDDHTFELYLNDSLSSTQPASNKSTSSSNIINTTNNTPIQYYRSNDYTSYDSNVPILQTPSPTTPFNNQYGVDPFLL